MPWHHNTKLNTCLSLSKSWVIWEESMKQKAITLAILASIWSSSEGFYAESCSITFPYLSSKIITFSLHPSNTAMASCYSYVLGTFLFFVFLFFFLELLCSLFAQCHVLHKPLAFSFSYQCTTHIHFRHFSSHFFLRHWCPAPLCVTKCFVFRLLLIMDFWLIIPG